MSEPIVERVAQWLLAALQEITEANAYQQTLHVWRPLTLEPPAESIGDLGTILEMGPREEASKPTNTHRCWQQTFHVSVHLLGDAADGVPIDQRINRVVADVEKRIGVEVAAQRGGDTLCGGLAYRLHVAEPEIWIDRRRQATIVLVPIETQYKVLITDPYAQ